MQRFGWAWTVRLTAVGLALAFSGCDGKNGTANTTPVGGTTSSDAGRSSRGGASTGGTSARGAAAGKASVGGTSAGGAGNGGKSSSSAGANTGGRIVTGIAGNAGQPTACAKNADCANGAGSQTLCSVPTNECVECVTASDCAPSGTAGAAGAAGAPNLTNIGCVKNACVNYTTCINSLGCALGQVCDTALGRCAQCAKDADCPSGTRCGQNQCRSSCTSDKDCTPLGLLCNSSAGYCVSCNSTADCAANRYCSGGECLRDVCVGGSTRCQSNGLSTCYADGSGWGAPVACASSRTCTTNATGVAACQPWTCTPSTTACSTTEEKVISCSADGMTATTVTDCGSKSQVCVSGACAAVVCTPSQRFCQSNVVRTCSVKGDSSSPSTTCTASQYCDATTTTCKTLVCTPNQPGCSSTVATTCNADGSGWLAGGIDCTTGSSGQVCSAGTCQAQLCTPSTYFCDNAAVPNSIQYCSTTGLTSSLSLSCSTTQYCDATTTPTCKARLCTPGAPACNGNIATTCNSLGSGYVAGGTNCTGTAAPVCSAGTCSTIAVDTLDPSASSSSSYYTYSAYTLVNFYAATVSRTLTQLELYFYPYNASMTLTWTVYEAATQTGTYSPIWTGTSAAAIVSGYKSTSAISVPIRAGYFYAIATAWPSQTYSYYYYYRSATTFPIAVSFGTLTGSGTTTTYPASSSLYYPQRITTNSPL